MNCNKSGIIKNKDKYTNNRNNNDNNGNRNTSLGLVLNRNQRVDHEFDATGSLIMT